MIDRVITRTKYFSRFEESGMDDIDEICRSVSSSELFVGIPSCEIEEMVSRARTLEFASGDMIHSADDLITQVLLLTEGRIKRSQFSENGQEVVLRLGVPGEIISVPTFLPRGKHSSNVLALQDCKVLAWESASFYAIVERSPDLLKNVEVILNSRLADITQRVIEASTKATSPRLARSLVHLVDRIGEKVDDHIELRVSQETLGQMTGMAFNSVSRLFSVWKGQGIVKLRRGIVEIHSLPHLLSCAELVHTSAQNAGLGDEVVPSAAAMVGINQERP
jgi:CRP/FNR family transcriptional regulator, nitrogen oxide reductase regulator